MKRFGINYMKLIILLLIISLLCISCKKKQQCEQVQFRVWNGQNFSLEEDYPLPVCIIWQSYSRGTRGNWDEYKSFSQGVEIKHIIELINSPEIKEQRPDLRTHNKLILIFPFDIDNVRMFPIMPVKIVQLYFDVNDGIFVCPAGKSKILGKIFMDKPESGLYMYRMPGMSGSEKDIKTLEKNIESIRLGKNKIDKGEDVNNATDKPMIPFFLSFSYELLDRMKKTLEFIREEERKFKEQYGIQESNQPSQKHSARLSSPKSE